MKSSMHNWTIEIAGEVEEKQGDFPTNLVVDVLAKFFDLLGLKTDSKKKASHSAIPFFRAGEEEIRLLVLTPYSTKTLEEYFKNLIFAAYSTEGIRDISKQRFLFVESELTNKDWRYERFFHVLGSIFKHSGVAWKVQVEKLLTFLSPEFIKNIEGNPKSGSITGSGLRNCIEETCFVTGVEEMREFFFRDPATSMLHDLFHKVPEDRRNALRLIVGAYLAGDISLKFLNLVLKKFLPDKVPPIDLINEGPDKQIPDRMKNPLWKYLENRKILIIDDGWEKEGWNIVLPAILLSPEKIEAALPPNVMWYESIKDALHASEVEKKFDLKDIDLILLDLYSSSADDHIKSVQITNMKDPLWEHREKIYEIRTRYIRESIPQPMPQIVVFSRDNYGTTARTMFKELNTVDYFFKNIGTEEHKCGYYSSFRNAVISSLKENVYEVGGMTDISSRQHFNQWLRQFDPCDRPVILHLMKHFKYFPAINIMKLLDSYLENNTRWEDGAVRILNSRPRKPSRFYISYLKHPNKSGPSTLALLSKTEWLRKLKKESKKRGLNEHPRFLSYEDSLQCIVEDILTNDDEEPLCLVFIDDFIGSGGQLDKYSGEFISEDLKAICEKLFVKHRSKGAVWEKVKRAFSKEQKDYPYNIEIIALYALGLQNKDVESMISDFRRNNDETQSICGIFKVDLKGEGLFVPVQVHVAHYTRNIQEIFKDNQKFLNEVEETLKKYAVIMELRDEDYPCDFEPWGWKANGGLIATYANAQGNTIPVIWRDYRADEDLIARETDLSLKEWFALYPRYFNPLTPGKKKKKAELTCFKDKKCCLQNPGKWNEQFFEKYWENQDNEDPPCKIKSSV